MTETKFHDFQYRKLIADILMIAFKDATRNPCAFESEIDIDEAIVKRRQAQGWIESKNDKPQSFIWWCKKIGLSSERLRRGINKINGDIFEKVDV